MVDKFVQSVPICCEGDQQMPGYSLTLGSGQDRGSYEATLAVF